MKKEEAVFGGGCFWCLEAAFRLVDGVIDIVNGYAGGEIGSPTYKEVCSGLTGHAEVVRIIYDSDRISYKELLKIFFMIHDPTTQNRQGNDVGSQYRSIILYKNIIQKEAAEKYINELEETGEWKGVVTEVKPLDKFWPAEEYHQHYYEKHPEQAYCQIVIRPKIEKLNEKLNK